jgi:hypothetical protein
MNPFAGTAMDRTNAQKVDQDRQRLRNENELRQANVKNIKQQTQTSNAQEHLNDQMRNLSNQQEQKTIFDREASRNSVYKTAEEINTQAAQTAYWQNSAAEKLTASQLNSARSLLSDKESGLKSYDLTERQHLHKLRQWTGPVREIIDTASDIVPFKRFLKR